MLVVELNVANKHLIHTHGMAGRQGVQLGLWRKGAVIVRQEYAIHPERGGKPGPSFWMLSIQHLLCFLCTTISHHPHSKGHLSMRSSHQQGINKVGKPFQ